MTSRIRPTQSRAGPKCATTASSSRRWSNSIRSRQPPAGRGVQFVVGVEEPRWGAAVAVASRSRSASAQVQLTAGSMKTGRSAGSATMLPRHRSPCVRTAGLAGTRTGSRAHSRSRPARSDASRPAARRAPAGNAGFCAPRRTCDRLLPGVLLREPPQPAVMVPAVPRRHVSVQPGHRPGSRLPERGDIGDPRVKRLKHQKGRADAQHLRCAQPAGGPQHREPGCLLREQIRPAPPGRPPPPPAAHRQGIPATYC